MVAMQGIVRHDGTCSKWLIYDPVLLGAHAVRERLTKHPKLSMFLVASPYIP